jgi:hypothetical protein
MRITIEMNEVESRFTTLVHESAAGAPTSPDNTSPALDGGSPPDALLAALGAAAGRTTNGHVTNVDEVDAGEPPSWLVEAVAAGVSPRFR